MHIVDAEKVQRDLPEIYPHCAFCDLLQGPSRFPTTSPDIEIDFA
jgi:hypothetical protein